MREKRKSVAPSIGLALALLASMIIYPTSRAVAASKFPERAVTIICPFRPGGGTDIELRNISPFVQKYLGQAVVVKSMPGAATTIGMTAAEASRPDGYTLAGTVLPDAILAQEFHDSGTHIGNFVPIYGWFQGPMAIAVNADSPYKTFSDLVEAGKHKTLKAALSGIGSIDHLHTMLLEKYMGIKAVTIPYGGGGPATKAVMSGEVDFFVGLSTTSVRFVRDRKVRLLAVMGPERLKALPDVPTIYELGYKDYPDIEFIRGVMAPPGTPEDVADVLRAAFKKAVEDPGFLAIMAKQGRPVKAFSSQDMKKAVADADALAKEYMPFMKKAAQKK